MNRNTPEEFDAIWKREKHDPASFDRDKKFFQRIVDLSWWAGSVIDAGCGVGVILAKLSQKKKIGVDFSAEAVSALPSDCIGIVADLRDPWPHPREDLVVCTETLEHFLDGDLEKVLWTLRRMAPKFVVSVPWEFPDPFHMRQFGRDGNLSHWLSIVSDDFKLEKVEEGPYSYLVAYGSFRDDLPL